MRIFISTLFLVRIRRRHLADSRLLVLLLIKGGLQEFLGPVLMVSSLFSLNEE